MAAWNLIQPWSNCECIDTIFATKHNIELLLTPVMQLVDSRAGEFQSQPISEHSRQVEAMDDRCWFPRRTGQSVQGRNFLKCDLTARHDNAYYLSQFNQCPWGPWPKDPHLKEIGRYQYINAIESVDSYGLALMTRSVGYTEEQAKIFLAIVKNQLRTKSLHAYNLM